MKITVEIDNITDKQAIALEDMFRTWEFLGNVGSSRWTAFYADGDGNFHPNILIDGKKPKFSDKIDRDDVWEGDEYRIDFDTIK